MRKLLFLLLLPVILCAQDEMEPPHETPEQIQAELNAAENRFQRAQKMFNPWYAGPLVTPSASMMPPGSANIQPYLFINAKYAAFNEDRKAVSLPHNAYQLLITPPMQIGVTESTDIVIATAVKANWQDNHSGGGFADLGVTYGFKIQKESLYIPKFKFTVAETFPTGKYKHLKPTGLDGTGSGSYQTQFGFAAGKVVWWTYPHPMNTRLFIGYTIAATVHVSGFNAYGGGFGCHGKVRPGNTLTVDFGYEISINQPWVFALDVVYVAQNSTKFHGFPGTLSDGTLSSVSSGFNDNLSLAPAFEYNFTDSLAILWGVQFSVYGRNSADFVNGQFSVEYTW